MWAKERWLAGDVQGAREILGQVLASTPPPIDPHACSLLTRASIAGKERRHPLAEAHKALAGPTFETQTRWEQWW